MAAIPLDQGITFMRTLLRDTQPTFPGANDTEYALAANESYMSWFKNVEQRARLVTLIGGYPQGTLTMLSDPTATYPEILSAYRVDTNDANTGAVTSYILLERCEWNELIQLQGYDVTQGIPVRYAAFKAAGASEQWQVALHPVPSGDYEILAAVRVYPTPLSGTDTPDLGEAEGYWMYRIAAATLAHPIGKPELVEAILQPIPDDIRGKMGVERKRLDPKRRLEEMVL